MNYIKVNLAIILLFIAMPCFGQIRKDIQENKNTQLNIQRVKIVPVKTGKKVSKPDYVLYRELGRKNSWLVGLGDPISQDVANHLPVYFRLSMKNKAGNYQFIEAMHGNQLTSNHNVLPYVVDKSAELDSLTGKVGEWVKRVKTVGQWYMTSDFTGKLLVEERAYEAKEKNANLIYAFQPIQNDSEIVIGSYIDAWGLPVDIDGSKDCYYGNVVKIRYDKQGRDSIVDFLDGKGLRRYNMRGVDQIRFEYDSQNRVVLETGHNAVGDRINGNDYICGYKFEYDVNSNDYTIRCLDKELEPERGTYKFNNDNLFFETCQVKKDYYGRVAEIVLHGGNKQIDILIRRLVYEFNKDGSVKTVRYYNKDNREI